MHQSECGNIDMDDVMASATTAKSTNAIDAAHLSKVWQIDIETAKRTLEVTTQHSQRTQNPSLQRNYSTNN